MKNLNELAQKIHESNKLRGFDVSQDNIGQSLMLIVGEISEAMDAHQCGRFVPENSVECYSTTESIQILTDVFERHIKNTFEDELADIVIRTLDFCAAFDIDIDSYYNDTCATIYDKEDNVGSVLFNAVEALSKYKALWFLQDKMNIPYIARPIHIVETLAIRHDINLEKHIALKMRYNETRPYKHGKRY